MNTKNNKRRRESIEKIEKAFVELLQTRELKEITVSDICKMTELNRSTFYANYLDIYDLADKLRDKLERDFSELFQDDEQDYEKNGALKMFTHIKENQIFYKTYFKLGYDAKSQVMIYDMKRAEQDFENKNLKYHIEFFRNGINAMIKLWMEGGCVESPEEMVEILKQEYRGR
ncbi:MAG: TetR/AcrR family transcriptional regulator C-terminal domain-containing protein [Christensenellaceae bacterium]|nr:TetR/AcrR family transcriptional regulator C-terminal domain-containing protein [Christensenellaceae bacterium]